jgi:type IX secretion system PorP/SprF family membrane protein
MAMKKIYLILLVGFLSLDNHAQDLHFSQYYNSPLLLNPANTGYLESSDWRVGLNYRNQSGTIPVPYNTFSAFGDLGLFRNKWENSWLGFGAALWRDVSGNGNLALTKAQASLAAHVLGENMSFSIGLSAARTQRSVDFSKLTYDVQWDEFSFNQNISNQETFSTQKTSYIDMGLGLNIAFFNKHNFLMKGSVAAQHINRPTETFYGMNNKLGIRPILNVEAIWKATERLIITPSVYYTSQKKASEFVAGSLINVNTGSEVSLRSNELIVGFFFRNKDAVIGKAGYQFGTNRVMLSYDHTISDLTTANKGVGAFELALILQGNYKKDNEATKTLGCPRF